MLLIKKLHADAIIPERATPLSSGYDLHVLDVVPVRKFKESYDSDFIVYTMYPGERVLVRTGIAIELYEGIEAQVRPRSGLALKHGVTVLNTPGTIDADYVSDIGVILINLSDTPFVIRKGDRIAQLAFQPVLHEIELIEAYEIANTKRGGGCFGSTGIS